MLELDLRHDRRILLHLERMCVNGKTNSSRACIPFYVEDLILEMWCYGASKKFMFDSWLSFLIVEGRESNTVRS